MSKTPNNTVIAYVLKEIRCAGYSGSHENRKHYNANSKHKTDYIKIEHYNVFLMVRIKIMYDNNKTLKILWRWNLTSNLMLSSSSLLLCSNIRNENVTYIYIYTCFQHAHTWRARVCVGRDWEHSWAQQ